jgi:hypothetical protein
MISINKKKFIFVQFQKEGIHRYPEAATDPALATGDEYDVSFLASPHRHIFHFRVELSVTHDNRDVEFIQFKRWLENLYKDATLTLDYKSCEMMGEELYSHISAKYPNRDVRIEISEDGENGCYLEFNSSMSLT